MTAQPTNRQSDLPRDSLPTSPSSHTKTTSCRRSPTGSNSPRARCAGSAKRRSASYDRLTEYAVFVVSIDGRVVSWNSGAQQTFGYTQAEIIDRSFEIFFTPEDAAIGAPQSELTEALAGGKMHHDRWHVRKDTSRFWGTNTVQPLYDSGGVHLGFTKLVRDTTS